MPRALYKAFLALAFFICLFPTRALADTIFLSPLLGTFDIGDTFSLRVMVSSPRQAINALSGTLSFPTDKLQVTSVSKIGSILSLWVQEPSFSNSQGVVNFEGIVPNPGFSESNGRVLAINFKVVGTGPAEVMLTSGSLLANDGYGTNVLKTLGNANFFLQERNAVLPQTPPAVIEEGNSDRTGKETLVDLPARPIEKETPQEESRFKLPSIEAIASDLIKFFSLIIPLLALFFFFIHTTKKGVGNIKKLRRDMRRDLQGIDRVVGKSFDILREDLSDIISMLEHAKTKRKLTLQENDIIRRLKRNLSDAENIIEREIVRVEKDIDE